VNRFQATFLALVLAQAAHSVEEYAGRLWETLLPVQVLTELVMPDPGFGFIVLNAAFIAFGLWCVLGPALGGRPSAVPLAWIWVAVELVNGVGHPALALIQGRYLPGTVTALVLLPLALYLGRQLLRGSGAAAA